MNEPTNETNSSASKTQSTNPTSDPRVEALGKQCGESIQKTATFITRWRAPFVSFLSYIIILGLGTTGLFMMASSLMLEFFTHKSALSFLSLLTGSGFVVIGTLLLVWKLNQGLGVLKQAKTT